MLLITHVRYVLAFGLAGVIAAFAVISVYFGYDDLANGLSALLALDPLQVMREATPYALTILVGVISAVLLLRLWNSVAGSDDNASQTLMRVRMVVQPFAICATMVIYLLAHA